MHTNNAKRYLNEILIHTYVQNKNPYTKDIILKTIKQQKPSSHEL